MSAGKFGHVRRTTSKHGVPAVEKVVEETSNELEILRSLVGSLHVVQLFAESSPGLLLMEECATSLEGFLKSQKSPLQRADFLRLTKGILEGLAFTHARRIMHGDVKPSNILVSHDMKTWKLCDFGNASRMDENGMCRPRRGYTNTFVAPEVIIACDQTPITDVAGESADMWSFAVTLADAACSDEDRACLEEKFSGSTCLNAFLVLKDVKVVFVLLCIQGALQALSAFIPNDILLSMFCIDPNFRFPAQSLLSTIDR